MLWLGLEVGMQADAGVWLARQSREQHRHLQPGCPACSAQTDGLEGMAATHLKILPVADLICTRSSHMSQVCSSYIPACRPVYCLLKRMLFTLF